MKPVKHFMDCWDYSTEELLALADLIRRLKKDAYEGTVPKLLQGQSIAMIFNGNSTRTRISFEVAAQQLGAHALFLTGGPEGELHLGKRETIGDTARVVSSMVDGIAMRWRNTKEMEEFVAQCSVPFFNGMDHTRHPTQTLCDFVTILEHLPEGKELKDTFLPRGARGDEPGGGDHRRVAERPEQNDDKEGIILLIAAEAGDDSRGQRDVHADLRRHVIIILTEEADAFQKISEYYYKDRGESAL